MFFIILLKSVGLQILALFGIFFVFGYILSKLQQWINKQYVQTIGWKGILFTAWIGTPIHELSHLIIAKIFGHTITHVDFFEPNPHTGGLGHVEHSYPSRSFLARVGNFFIGSAPMFGGAIALVILFYIFVPNAKDIYPTLAQQHYSLINILYASKNFLIQLLSFEHINTPIFYAFLYFSFCVSSHIAPSPQDLSNMWSGFVFFVILLLLVNAIPVYFGIYLQNYLSFFSSIITLFISFFTYALIISLLHLFLSSLFLKFFHRIIK